MPRTTSTMDGIDCFNCGGSGFDGGSICLWCVGTGQCPPLSPEMPIPDLSRVFERWVYYKSYELCVSLTSYKGETWPIEVLFPERVTDRVRGYSLRVIYCSMQERSRPGQSSKGIKQEWMLEFTQDAWRVSLLLARLRYTYADIFSAEFFLRNVF